MNVEQDEPRFVVQDPESGTVCPPGWLWLVYLYFRPRTFFTHFVIDSTPGLTVLCAWFFGMAGVIDRIHFRALSHPEIFIEMTWTVVWVLILVGGIIGGFFYFAIGGWWFRTRLRWSGSEDPDPDLARRVYVFASMIWALPILFSEVVETGQFSTPWLCYQSAGSLWDLLWLAPLFWSIWTEYVGVRTAFEVRRGLAILWFLVLPVVVCGVGIVLVGLSFFFEASGPADVALPLTFNDGQTMKFYYPGNWWINADDSDYDPDVFISVEPMQDALVQILVYEATEAGADELDATVSSYAESLVGLTKTREFDSCGTHRGVGQVLEGRMQGDLYRLRVFVSEPIAGQVFEIQELWLSSDAAEVVPGLDLIRSTFRLR